MASEVRGDQHEEPEAIRRPVMRRQDTRQGRRATPFGRETRSLAAIRRARR